MPDPVAKTVDGVMATFSLTVAMTPADVDQTGTVGGGLKGPCTSPVVPVIAPVELFSFSPSGKDPRTTLY